MFSASSPLSRVPGFIGSTTLSSEVEGRLKAPGGGGGGGRPCAGGGALLGTGGGGGGRLFLLLNCGDMGGDDNEGSSIE